MARHGGIMLLIAAAVLGCSPDTGPPPSAGYNLQQPRYAAPPTPDAPVIEVPDVTLAELPEKLVEIHAAGSVASGRPLAFEGVIRVPDREQAGGIVHIEFVQQRPNGLRVITQTGQQLVIWKDSPDGHIHYRVEMKAPSYVGKQQVEMKLLHKAPEPIPFARGEVVISN